jgi:signal transduction histidine kinase
MNNRPYIDRLEVEVIIRQWEDRMDDEFCRWHQQILQDYDNNQKFRELIEADANSAASKGNGTYEGCRSFILEECAYICAHLKGSIIAYPMRFYESIISVIGCYDINIKHLSYKPSSYSRKRSNSFKNISVHSVISFLTTALDANFFIIDKNGNYIYKNNALTQIIGNVPANIVAPKAWELSMMVMETKKATVLEEEFNNNHFLSAKGPLLINDSVEGIMGVSIDITAKKQAEQLLLQNSMQKIQIEERVLFSAFTGQLLHDIASPVSMLEVIMMSTEISERVRMLVREIVRRIKDLIGTLKEKHGEYASLDRSQDKVSLLLAVALKDIIVQQQYIHKETGIIINYSYDPSAKFTFLHVNKSELERTIVNLLNNAIESLESSGGVVDVSFVVNGKWVDIIVKDNGVGMSPEMVTNICSIPNDVISTKHSGRGLGLRQVFLSLESLNGLIDVESQLGKGTTFLLRLPALSRPDWIVDMLVFRKGDVIVILDDDESIFPVYQEIFAKYSDDVVLEFFTNSRDALKFIKSQEYVEKICFICDYELSSDDFKGLAVILQSGVKQRSLLVTEAVCDNKLHEMVLESGVRVVPKQFIRDLPIVIT